MNNEKKTDLECTDPAIGGTLLIPYLQEELTPRLKTFFENHLLECASCSLAIKEALAEKEKQSKKKYNGGPDRSMLR